MFSLSGGALCSGPLPPSPLMKQRQGAVTMKSLCVVNMLSEAAVLQLPRAGKCGGQRGASVQTPKLQA
ncbi:hypothetical protein CHARACLAT_018890 [Characodon lateralis]|uniref:Uncharacterized protein n=1 Tax=Characodon lateralis TaxID=208331 RepID=A0ABU7EV45_9TELE|nr:hypothetical protein [Characodon lateralis]